MNAKITIQVECSDQDVEAMLSEVSQFFWGASTAMYNLSVSVDHVVMDTDDLFDTWKASLKIEPAAIGGLPESTKHWPPLED
jgi:hypothetical protein